MSVDVQFTTFTPTSNSVVPSGGLHRTMGVPDTAYEMGVSHLYTPVVNPGVRNVVELDGQKICGGVLN